MSADVAICPLMYDQGMSVDVPESPAINAPILLTVDEACSALRVSRATVYEMFKDGRMDWVMVGRSRRIPRVDIENWVERNRASRLTSAA